MPSSVPISIKPSIDGVGRDARLRARLPEGNFDLLDKDDRTSLLEPSASENPRLHVDLGTVISNLNIHHLDEIEDWVHARGIESYRHEIAEQRAEFHNLGRSDHPAGGRVYEKLTERFKNKIAAQHPAARRF